MDNQIKALVTLIADTFFPINSGGKRRPNWTNLLIGAFVFLIVWLVFRWLFPYIAGVLFLVWVVADAFPAKPTIVESPPDEIITALQKFLFSVVKQGCSMSVFALTTPLDAGNLIFKPLPPMEGRNALLLSLMKLPTAASPEIVDTLGRYLQSAFERRDTTTDALFRGFGISPKVMRVEDAGLYYYVTIKL